MNLPPLLVLRHGETEWNLAGRLQGHLDSPLTETGKAQARRQNAILTERGVAGYLWMSSPQGRAQATAQIAAHGLSSDIACDDRLMEIGMGDWSGWHRDDIAAAVPHLFDQDSLAYYDAAPNGEGLAALERRTSDFLHDLTQPTVIVTHGITSRILRCHAQHIDPSAFSELPGGQGNVYEIADGKMSCLT